MPYTPEAALTFEGFEGSEGSEGSEGFEQLFTRQEAVSLAGGIEGLVEAESTEGVPSLEDVQSYKVAEFAESLTEGEDGYGNGYTRRSPSSSVNKQLLKTFTIIIKKLVKKIMSNSRTRAKLQAAIRKGPTAIAQLLTPSVAQVLPSYFRWLAPIYVPPVTRVLFNPIRKEAGVAVEQVEGGFEAALEWDL